MKRNTILATAAALSMLAVPAMAQVPDRDHRGFDRDADYDGKRRIRPPVMMPAVSSYTPASAAPGATVTIFGESFVPGMKVMLDGDLIEPSFVGRKRIRFTVPAGARDGALSLVMPNRRRALGVGALDVIEPARRARRGYDDAGWTRTRRSRRAKSRRDIFARWSDRYFFDNAAVRAEFRLHARRLAKLNRMKRLARQTGQFRFTARINAAIRRENVRHDRAMRRLERSYSDIGRNRGRWARGRF